MDLNTPSSMSSADTPESFALASGRFDELYEREYPGLLGVATALSGRVADAEDLVHDTMVTAFIRWPKVSRLERPGGWCHRVLINRCRSWWRRRKTETSYMARQPMVEASAELSESTMEFWSLVRTLPSRQRTVVALYYAADLPTPDVAAILGLPEGTVRSDLSRARALLAPQLGVMP